MSNLQHVVAVLLSQVVDSVLDLDMPGQEAAILDAESTLRLGTADPLPLLRQD